MRAWPEVGSYPFCVTTAEVPAWEPRLETLLIAIATHVHVDAPFLRALTGFEGMDWDLEGRGLTRPGPIPATHGAGIIDVAGDGLCGTRPPFGAVSWTTKTSLTFAPKAKSGAEP